MRGTASTGFRAPTLAESYYSATNVGPTTAFVQMPPNAPATALLGLGAGLQPEKSTNYSLGFVFRPDKAMSLTFDLYQVEVRNRIAATSTFYGTIDGELVLAGHRRRHHRQRQRARSGSHGRAAIRASTCSPTA